MDMFRKTLNSIWPYKGLVHLLLWSELLCTTLPHPLFTSQTSQTPPCSYRLDGHRSLYLQKLIQHGLVTLTLPSTTFTFDPCKVGFNLPTNPHMGGGDQCFHVTMCYSMMNSTQYLYYSLGLPHHTVFSSGFPDLSSLVISREPVQSLQGSNSTQSKFSIVDGANSLSADKLSRLKQDVSGYFQMPGIRSRSNTTTVVLLKCNRHLSSSPKMALISQQEDSFVLIVEHLCCCPNECRSFTLDDDSSEEDDDSSEEDDDSSEEDDDYNDDDNDDDNDDEAVHNRDGEEEDDDSKYNTKNASMLAEVSPVKMEGRGHAMQLWLVLGANLFIIAMAIIIGMVFCRSGSTGSGAFYNMLPGLHSSRLTLGSGESMYTIGLPKLHHPTPDYLEYTSALTKRAAMPTSDDGLINKRELDIGQRLGGGQFSDTYLADWKDRTVAAKRIMVIIHQTQLTEEDCTWICSQTVKLSKLRHKHLASVFGVCVDTRQPYVITEHIDGEPLHDLLRQTEEAMPWNTRIRLCQDACEGMNHLHTSKPPILHRDLRSANILVDTKKKRAKVVDFGMTHLIQRLRRECNSKQSSCFCRRDMCAVPQSVRWTAPELLYHPTADEAYDHDIMTTALDVYSIAMVFWEVATATDPFDDIPDDMEVVELVKAGGRPRLDNVQYIPPGFGQLIKACWSHDPNNRPSFKQVLTELKPVVHATSKPQESRQRTVSATYKPSESRQRTVSTTSNYMKSLFGSQEA